MSVSPHIFEKSLPEASVSPSASEKSSQDIQCLDPMALPDWDDMLSAHPGATIFHSRAWAQVLQSTYGHQPNYLARRTDHRIDACLPLMEVRSRLTGTKGVALPFTDLCLPVGDQDGVRTLFERALKLGNERSWRYLEMRGLPVKSIGLVSLSFLGHSLDLRATEDELLRNFDSSVRRAIRKAELSGLVVSVGTSLEDMRVYYELHGRTRQRQGVPPQPWHFFKHLQQFALEAGKGFVITARLEGRPISSAVFLHFGHNATYKFGASDLRFQEHRGNNLVMWHGIRECRKRGCQRFHFGRTSNTNEGLRRFKLGFGATEEVINYLRLNPQTLARLEMTDASEGWLNKLFTLVPRSVARFIGTALYPHAA